MSNKVKSKKKSLNTLFKLLKNFLEKKDFTITLESREDRFVYHYYSEILRYWNKLNFIVTRIYIKNKKRPPERNIELAKALYTVYCLLWEKRNFKAILEDVGYKYKKVLKALGDFSLENYLENKSQLEKLSICEAMPTFFIKKLTDWMSFDFLKENIVYMNNYNINDDNYFYIFSKLTAEQIISKIFEENKNIQKKLKNNKLSIEKDPELPLIYRVPTKHKSIFVNSRLHFTKRIILLDKGSATVASILEPKPNDIICDMCAAPGNKTILISHLTNDKADIIAGEFSRNRIPRTINLYKAMETKRIQLLNCDSILLPVRGEIKFDKILLDAPCTGSGTFATNPELKWRQNRGFLKQNIKIQEKLLESAIKMLKMGGTLVYSTCSLYAEEGEMQILKFLDYLEPLQLPEWFGKSYKIDDKEIAGTGRLFPAIHKTKGFFVGKFKKKEESS